MCWSRELCCTRTLNENAGHMTRGPGCSQGEEGRDLQATQQLITVLFYQALATEH